MNPRPLMWFDCYSKRVRTSMRSRRMERPRFGMRPTKAMLKSRESCSSVERIPTWPKAMKA